MAKNRCYGCEYFGGAQGCIVQCDNGHKGVFLKNGCSDFTPDITASCGGGTSGCFYNQNGRRISDLECSIHGFQKKKKTYCYDFAAEEDDCEPKKKSGCFVTTAVCDILGKDDKCFELEILRRFRDETLLTDENSKQLVYEYYDISPKLVSKIINLKNKNEFAKYLLNSHINFIIDEIQSNNKHKAISLYKNMLCEIESI